MLSNARDAKQRREAEAGAAIGMASAYTRTRTRPMEHTTLGNMIDKDADGPKKSDAKKL